MVWLMYIIWAKCWILHNFNLCTLFILKFFYMLIPVVNFYVWCVVVCTSSELLDYIELTYV